MAWRSLRLGTEISTIVAWREVRPATPIRPGAIRNQVWSTRARQRVACDAGQSSLWRSMRQRTEAGFAPRRLGAKVVVAPPPRPSNACASKVEGSSNLFAEAWLLSVAPQACPSYETEGSATFNHLLLSQLLLRGRASSQ